MLTEIADLVGQEIRCRIIELDVADENVVVDRRAVAEEEERAGKERRYSELKEGETVTGTVRSLMDYGAFIDLGGVDGLLHVGEISWSRINKPADLLSVGDQVSARVLKIDPDKRRISLGMKQLQAHPWEAVAGKYNIGDRVTGTVSRVMEFGAFVELEPGIEGLIHISEMSWGKKLRIASDIVKPGETVEVILLGINPAERRMALGLKQALGDPWAEAPKKFPVGSVVEGPVVRIMKFGAFIQLAEGVDGMVHVSDVTSDRRIDSPHDLLKVGQTVKAQVLAVDTEKRQVRLGMKQLVPTGVDEYLAEHKVGDIVSGRLMEVSGVQARAELGEGIFANCRISEKLQAPEETKPETQSRLVVVDLNAAGPLERRRQQCKTRAGQSWTGTKFSHHPARSTKQKNRSRAGITVNPSLPLSSRATPRNLAFRVATSPAGRAPSPYHPSPGSSCASSTPAARRSSYPPQLLSANQSDTSTFRKK